MRLRLVTSVMCGTNCERAQARKNKKARRTPFDYLGSYIQITKHRERKKEKRERKEERREGALIYIGQALGH